LASESHVPPVGYHSLRRSTVSPWDAVIPVPYRCLLFFVVKPYSILYAIGYERRSP